MECFVDCQFHHTQHYVADANCRPHWFMLQLLFEKLRNGFSLEGNNEEAIKWAEKDIMNLGSEDSQLICQS